jgi:2-hydroxychromene-2-carboxylate isomerase
MTSSTTDAKRRHVKFYFAYNSPYAFLANTRIVREVSPFDVSLEYKPIYAPRGGDGPDMTSPRMRYLVEDVARFAEAYGLDLMPGPFADTERACRGFFCAQAAGDGVGYHDAIFRARWIEGKDLAEDAVLVGAAETAGLDGEAFLDSLDDPRWGTALAASNADAEADAVFGVPFFVYDSKRFWGNDRIEWLVRELQKRG